MKTKHRSLNLVASRLKPNAFPLNPKAFQYLLLTGTLLCSCQSLSTLCDPTSELIPPGDCEIKSGEVWYRGKKVGNLEQEKKSEKLEPLPGGITGYEVTELENGNKFLSGGNLPGDDVKASKKTFFWSNAKKQMEPGPDMSVPRVEHNVTRISGNRLFISGGKSFEPKHTFAKAIDIVDLSNKSIKSGGEAQVDRIEHSVLEMNPECIVLVGGMTFDGPSSNGMDTGSIETWTGHDPWTVKGNGLHKARRYPELFKLNERDFLVVGGYNADSDQPEKPIPVEKVHMDEHF